MRRKLPKGCELVIKGVNRQVIEVTDTGNAYYERAWLVVKPEYAEVQRALLELEAKKLLRGMDSPSQMKPRRSVGFWALRLGMSALLGAVVTVVVQLIIGQ